MGQAEEIKSKLDIVEVIREYIPVKAVGANFQALCPFHNEKTPSFVISPDKQIWHCFGCGRGGDVFSFVMEKEALSFIETIRLLAPKAGVVLKYENQQDYSERNRLLDILELASKYYAHLLTGAIGQTAKEYLAQRALSAATVAAWQLGYSPDTWDALYKFLKTRPLSGKKYSDEEIFAAGLIIKKDGGRGYYDRFRDRIMFPISDVNNNIIAFTARVNPNKEKTEKLGKYINSPQTKVYDKSRVLFGLNKAKTAIREQNLAIVVEGQMDVIACHQHGFENVVASSGTALTAEQVGLLKRFTNNVALLFDMDAAGQLAADRGIKEVLAQDMNLKIIVLPSAKDPDECLRNNPDDFRRAVADAKPMLAYYFLKISDGLDLESLDNKRLIRDKMFAMIDLVNNKSEQGYWLKKISEDLGFFENDIREEFLKWQAKHRVLTDKSPSRPSAAPLSAAPEVSREEKLAELLLALILRFPEFINHVSNNIELADLSANFSRFYKDFIIYYNKTSALDYAGLRSYLSEQGADEEKTLDKLILLGEKDFYSFEQAQAKTEINGIIGELKKYSRQRNIQKLQKEIARAEREGRTDDLAVLMAQLKDLMTL